VQSQVNSKALSQDTVLADLPGSRQAVGILYGVRRAGGGGSAPGLSAMPGRDLSVPRGRWADELGACEGTTADAADAIVQGASRSQGAVRSLLK
jgi:hypothetical protein